MNKGEKGITLIALIITVIVLLILAGTAVSIAVNGGDLFTKATQAREEWNAATVAEENEVRSVIDLLDEASTGITVVRGQDTDWRVNGSTLVEYLGDDTNVVIPNQIGNTKITAIGNLFSKGGDVNNDVKENMINIQSLTISNGITSIGNGAFAGCTGITGQLTIPSSVTAIGSGAFSGCTGLTGKLVIPSSVVDVYPAAFNGCTGLTEIEINYAELLHGPFNPCALSSCRITFGNNVRTIGTGAFTGCTGIVGDITIPSSVTSIEEAAFNACSGLNGKLTIPNSVTTMGPGVFIGTTFNTIEIDMTEIPAGIFNGHSVSSVTIGANVRTIKSTAFANCANLTSVTIPSTVTTIEANAFSGVAHIYYNGPAVDDGTHWGATAIN